MSATEHINKEYLSKVCCGDDAMLQTLVSMFIEEVPKQLAALSGSYKARDIENVSSGAHKLKSSLAMMGMSNTVSDLENIERNTKELHASGALPALIEKIEESCRCALEKLETEKILDREVD